MPAAQLSITIDDLPAMCMEDLPCRSPSHTDESDTGAARHILAAVRRHAIPVAVFVNSARFGPDGMDLLREWSDAGVEIGNHTASHLCVDYVPPPIWRADVLSCHRVLSAIGSPAPRFFRFPYLRTGSSDERKRSAQAYLKQLGYSIAPATAVNSEWLLAHYYHLALHAQARSLLDNISARLVAHVVGSVEAAERLARDRLGRAARHIVLLHINQLTAHRIGDLIEALDRKYELISLSEALRDPMFALPDRYIGPRGGSWLARIGDGMDAEIAAGRDWFTNEKHAILREFQPIFGWPQVLDTINQRRF